MTEVGHLIKTRRKCMGYSQGTVAHLIGLESPQYISNVERGICSVSIKLAKKICYHLVIKKTEMRSAMVKDYAAKNRRSWK